MDIPPLKTEADHANAVAEIETLMDAEPGSKEFDRLEVLSALVDAYESRVHPIAAPQPVDAILFRLEQLGDCRIEISDYTDVSGRLDELGWQPDDKHIGILPAQFETLAATDQRVLKLSRTRDLEKLFRDKKIPFSLVKKEGQDVGIIHTASVDWATGVGPTLLVSAALLSGNPQIVSLTLDTIAGHLTALFSEKRDRIGNATLEMVVEKQDKDGAKTFKKISYEGKPEVLMILSKTFDKVFDEEDSPPSA